MTRILVIDDDPLSRYTLRRILESNACEVVDVHNGALAITVAREKAVDLIITDIIMPEMDGLEFIIAIRQENPTLPIIAISGGGNHRGPVPLRHASKLGATYTLSKPFGSIELLQLVRDCLNRPARRLDSSGVVKATRINAGKAGP